MVMQIEQSWPPSQLLVCESPPPYSCGGDFRFSQAQYRGLREHLTEKRRPSVDPYLAGTISATETMPMALNDLEQALLDACKIALRAIEYDGDDRTAFRGAAFDALTRAIRKAESEPTGQFSRCGTAR